MRKQSPETTWTRAPPTRSDEVHRLAGCPSSTSTVHSSFRSASYPLELSHNLLYLPYPTNLFPLFLSVALCSLTSYAPTSISHTHHSGPINPCSPSCPMSSSALRHIPHEFWWVLPSFIFLFIFLCSLNFCGSWVLLVPRGERIAFGFSHEFIDRVIWEGSKCWVRIFRWV